jgi:hypothetical protein
VIPTEIPFKTRPTQSKGTPLLAAWKTEPIMKSAEAPIRVYLRENLSAGIPANKAPTKQPAERAPLIPPCNSSLGLLKYT